MFKIQSVIDNLMKKLGELYKPRQNMVIDDNICCFRDECRFVIISRQRDNYCYL